MGNKQEHAEKTTSHIGQIGYVDFTDTRIHCRFDICQQGLVDWVMVRITKDLIKGDIVIPCPDSTCANTITLLDMQNSLDQDRIEQVLDKLLNVYVGNQNDVRKGPNIECNNAGIITPKPCYEPMVGDGCDYKWKDISQYTFRDKIKHALLGKHTISTELLSYLSEILRGEPCPKCGIVIFKLGGCPHMICQVCNFEFGWDCLGYYKDYQHKGDTLCPLRIFMLYPFLMLFLFMVNFKLCYTFSIIANVEKMIANFILNFLASTLILSALIFEALLIDKLRRSRKFRPHYRGKEYKGVMVLIILYPILWVSLTILGYQIPEMEKIIYFLVCEFFILSGALILFLLKWSGNKISSKGPLSKLFFRTCGKGIKLLKPEHPHRR